MRQRKQRSDFSQIEVNPEDISDVDISDLSDIDTDSDGENDEVQDLLPRNEDGDRSSWSGELRNVIIQGFTGNYGPTSVLDANKEEIDFFNLIFPAILFEQIAKETNRQADSEQEKNGDDPRWRATTPEEVLAYIAVQIIMGIIVVPTQDMYFSKDDLFRPTGINERFTRDRLDKLNQYFHVTDTSTNPPCR